MKLTYDAVVRQASKRFRSLTGMPAGIAYLLFGSLYVLWKANWAIIGSIMPNGRTGTLQNAINGSAMIGAMLAIYGLCLVFARIGRHYIVYQVERIDRMQRSGTITETQASAAKRHLFKSISADMIVEFLDSAARVDLQSVSQKCINSLKTYAKEIYANGD